MSSLNDTKFYCYIIANNDCNSKSSSNRQRTYNGYTVNLKRRLRQHNGEIKEERKLPELNMVMVLHSNTYLSTMDSCKSNAA